MGIWQRLFGSLSNIGLEAVAREQVRAYGEAEFYDITDPRVLEFLRDGNPTASGRYVNEKSAMKNPTFNRAVTVISQTMAMLPLNLMARDATGDIAKASDHPAHQLLKPRGKPNDFQDPFKFKTYMQGRALIHGDAFAYKVPGVRKTQALIPMDPCKVEVKLTADFRLEYHWHPQNSGQKRVLKADEVLHLRSPWSSDGINGDGLIKLLGEALGLAEAADEAASRLLKNGAYVGGVLKHPTTLSKEAGLRLREQFEERHAGPENAGRWMLLEEGLDAQPFGMSGKDAQGLENRKYQAEEVSRGTGVPRPLLMFDETSWGSGIEQLGLFFITYCLAGWFTAWEEALAASLLTDAERETHFFKFNEGALLRGSLKDQAEFLSKAIGGPGAGGYMLADEARDKMDMNKLPDGLGQKPAWLLDTESGNDPTE